MKSTAEKRGVAWSATVEELSKSGEGAVSYAGQVPLPRSL